MLPTTVGDVQAVFERAKNLNAALKNFLKKEGSHGAEIASFAKDFRAAASSGKLPAIQSFIERNLVGREALFMGVARYAFPELVESCVTGIIEKHAESFNATYERGDDGVVVKDARAFGTIAQDVHEMIRRDIKGAEFPQSAFLENAILASVFEVEVLPEVLKALGHGPK